MEVIVQEVFEVPQVSCGHCKTAIEGALAKLTGVQAAEVDVGRKTVSVVFDEAAVDRGSVVEEIEQAGYKVSA